MDKAPIIVVLDPFSGGRNLGDKIILDAVLSEIDQIFPNSFKSIISLRQPLAKIQQATISEAKHVFVAGSNMLSGNSPFLKRHRRWQISFLDNFSKKVVLLGAGWSSTNKKPTWMGRALYGRALSSNYSHAIRDATGVKNLRAMGFSNVLNTSCPTLWQLTRENVGRISKQKGEYVVTTLTDYNRDHARDYDMLKTLSKHYRKVFLWPQGMRDLSYFSELNFTQCEVLPATIKAYNELLCGDLSVDYVGTRLHGGIRALQYGRRTRIFAVDHRAMEIGDYLRGVVVCRSQVEELAKVIQSESDIEFDIPEHSIQKWRNQFISCHG